ncbi:MAG: 2-oxo acid dehydrogenase subunit E2 [Flavobacteriales bacterium]|nr:2-oxo acid dehydrogenase subunit E2 [Flavobacteriales bacterium]
MADLEILLPKMGESVAEATIIKWLKNEGDAVEADEPIVEIATDKVDSEVPAPQDGILTRKLVGEGEVVKVGQAVALIGTEAGASTQGPAPVKTAPSPAPAPANGNGSTAQHATSVAQESTTDVARTGPSGKFYSPLVRNIARKEGLTMAELELIQGTGMSGRVTKKDILNFLPDRDRTGTPAPVTETAAPTSSSAQPASAPATKVPGTPAVLPAAGDEVIEMDRMRRLIADHMVMSKHTSPHVTSYVEADVTGLVLWRERVKLAFEKREGEKLTFTPIFIQAIVQAIKEMPMVNVQVNGYEIIKKRDINIGMATALPSGNLIVPVIRNADRMNLIGLAAAVNGLAQRARDNKLSPDEITGGTYTMTNVGTFGNVMGTPVINQPQVAIMATGAIRKKPAVISTPAGDMIGIRHMMFLSHSYDHRVVDGALGGRFVRRVADILEAWSVDKEY